LDGAIGLFLLGEVSVEMPSTVYRRRIEQEGLKIRPYHWEKEGTGPPLLYGDQG
jgi:hypothetical protein